MESETTYNNRRNGKNDIIITETNLLYMIIYIFQYTSKHQQIFNMSSVVKKDIRKRS